MYFLQYYFSFLQFHPGAVQVRVRVVETDCVPVRLVTHLDYHVRAVLIPDASQEVHGVNMSIRSMQIANNKNTMTGIRNNSSSNVVCWTRLNKLTSLQ